MQRQTRTRSCAVQAAPQARHAPWESTAREHAADWKRLETHPRSPTRRVYPASSSVVSASIEYAWPSLQPMRMGVSLEGNCISTCGQCGG